jgi:hypothetical protein
MDTTVRSINGSAIRWTEDRWAHICEEHGELAGQQDAVLQTVRDPQRVLKGTRGELLAVREISPGKVLVVVYREHEIDGFIITAFFTRKLRQLERRSQVWP